MKRPEGFSARGTKPASPSGTGRSAPKSRALVKAAAKRRQRAEKSELKTFTSHSRHRRRVWAVSLGSVAIVVLGTVLLVLSPALALKTVRVEGAERVSHEDINTRLAGLYGEPLARVSNERVGKLLEPVTLIQGFTTRIEPPNTLVLTLQEREPVGVVSQSSGFSVVDAAGVVLWSQAEVPADLPMILVEADATSPSFSAVSRVLMALPDDIGIQVEGISASTLDNVRFTMKQSSHEVLWGSAERSGEKARVLGAALRAAGTESPRVIDVTTPDSVVIRARD
jgi:cell division protein FtsQ